MYITSICRVGELAHEVCLGEMKKTLCPQRRVYLQISTALKPAGHHAGLWRPYKPAGQRVVVP